MLITTLLLAAIQFATVRPAAAPAKQARPASPPAPVGETSPVRPPAAIPGAPPLSDYIPEEIAGFRVLMHPSIAKLPNDRKGRFRTVLTFDLETITRTIPAPALAAIRTIPIAVTHDVPASPGYNPRGACFHPSAGWLEAHGLDRAREGSVEILSIDDYIDWRAVQPAMLFHELSHAYHWLLGFSRPDISAAYTAANDSGTLYRNVPHTLDPGTPTPSAYALTNEHEYFAELSEAWFLRNDLFPFIRSDLVTYDPKGAAVIEQLWNLSADDINSQMQAAGHSSAGSSAPSDASDHR